MKLYVNPWASDGDGSYSDPYYLIEVLDINRNKVHYEVMINPSCKVHFVENSRLGTMLKNPYLEDVISSSIVQTMRLVKRFPSQDVLMKMHLIQITDESGIMRSDVSILHAHIERLLETMSLADDRSARLRFDYSERN